MRPRTILAHLALLLCLLATSCAPKAVPVTPQPPPVRIVTVTDPAPASRAVETQTKRLEEKVADTARRVASIDDTVTKSVEEAIRAGDAVREAEARKLQTELRALRAVTEAASEKAKELQEDVQAAQAQIQAIAAERDRAYVERETLRTKAIMERQESIAQLSRMDEKRIAEATRADDWKRRAVRTWTILGAICLVAVGLKAYRFL